MSFWDVNNALLLLHVLSPDQVPSGNPGGRAVVFSSHFVSHCAQIDSFSRTYVTSHALAVSLPRQPLSRMQSVAYAFWS